MQLSVAEQLAMDLTWLEGYFRPRTDMTAAVLRLRLSAASMRNSVAPYFKTSATLPLHIAVVGGAGVGKSTVTNFLIGQTLAEANPMAGYTRHPTAFISSDTQGFSAPNIGPLLLQSKVVTADTDQDIFQIRSLSQPIPGLPQVIVWDCPDMTTWRSTGYSTRLVEIIGLADVIIYVASDERYNDATPTEYLKLMLQAGKPVITCLTKMRPGDAPRVLEHFRKEVLGPIPECTNVSATMTFPFVDQATLLDPTGQGKEYRDILLQHVNWWTKQSERTRKDVVRRAVENAHQQSAALLEPVHQELEALSAWDRMVEAGQKEFTDRYRKECIATNRLASFDAALVRLIELLELPGVGKYISKTMHVLRSPYRLIRGMFSKPNTRSPLSEETLVQSAFQSWLDGLHREVEQQPVNHPYWKRFRSEFTGIYTVQAKDEFERAKGQYGQEEQKLIESTAKSIYEDLEKNPTALNTIRGFKFALEAGTIGATVVTAGMHLLWDVALIPVIASMTQALVEVLGKQYVDKHREETRNKQEAFFKSQLAEPMEKWMRAWPRRQYPEMVQLHETAQRIPDLITRLKEEMQSKTSQGVAA